MMYGNTLNPYGLRDGKVISVENLNPETEYGLKCNCICPSCSKPLIARIKGKVREKHFAHQGGSDCGKAYESAVHRLVKEVIDEYGVHIRIPRAVSSLADGGYCVVNGVVKCNSVLSESQLITPEEGKTRIEEARGLIRPDVIIEVDGRELFIEILVTHAVDEEKRQRIRELGTSCIEIDFSYYKGTVLTEDQIAAALEGTNSNVKAKWIYNKKVEKLDSYIDGIKTISQVLYSPKQIKKETPLSDLGFEHEVISDYIVMNCPNRNRYSVRNNYYYSQLKDCRICKNNRGCISSFNSSIVNSIICVAGDNNVALKVEDVCSWVINMARFNCVPDNEEENTKNVRCFYGREDEFKTFANDPQVEEAMSTAERILKKRFDEEILPKRREKQRRLLEKQLEFDLSRLIFLADTPFGEWVEYAYSDIKMKTVGTKKYNCLTKKEICDTLYYKAREIWDYHCNEGKKLYQSDGKFRQTVKWLVRNPKPIGVTDSRWLNMIMESLKTDDGTYQRFTVEKPLPIEISICPLLELVI